MDNNSPPLSQQSTLQGDSTPEEASISPNIPNNSSSRPRDVTLPQDTQPPIYEQALFGLGFGTSDPFIQDQVEALTGELPLDGGKKPWWKRVGSNVSKFLDAFNENLLHACGEGFSYPFQGKVRKWKQNRRDKKERQRQGGS